MGRVKRCVRGGGRGAGLAAVLFRPLGPALDPARGRRVTADRVPDPARSAAASGASTRLRGNLCGQPATTARPVPVCPAVRATAPGALPAPASGHLPAAAHRPVRPAAGTAGTAGPAPVRPAAAPTTTPTPTPAPAAVRRRPGLPVLRRPARRAGHRARAPGHPRPDAVPQPPRNVLPLLRTGHLPGDVREDAVAGLVEPAVRGRHPDHPADEPRPPWPLPQTGRPRRRFRALARPGQVTAAAGGGAAVPGADGPGGPRGSHLVRARRVRRRGLASGRRPPSPSATAYATRATGRTRTWRSWTAVRPARSTR